MHGLNYIIKKICREDRVLIIDDVFDTGNTIKTVVEEIRQRARGNAPDDIRTAIPWFKVSHNETDIVPDFYLRETDEWLVFPHELDALTAEEMKAVRPRLHEIIHGPTAA